MENQGKLQKKTTLQIGLRRLANFIIGILYPGHRIYKSHDVVTSIHEAVDYKRQYNNVRGNLIERIAFYENRGKESGLGLFSNRDEDIVQMLKIILGIYK